MEIRLAKHISSSKRHTRGVKYVRPLRSNQGKYHDYKAILQKFLFEFVCFTFSFKLKQLQMTDHLAVIYNHGIYGAGDSRSLVGLPLSTLFIAQHLSEVWWNR